MFDNNSYVHQCLYIVAALASLMVLGKIFDETLYIVASLLTIFFSFAGLISLFPKSKECPKWLCDLVHDLIFQYLLFFLPAMIGIYAADKSFDILWLGIAMMGIAVMGSILRERTKAEAESTLAEVQEIKAEAENEKELVEILFRNRWEVVNKLCNIYYDKVDSTGAMKLIVREIEAELQVLRTPESIAEILATTDRCLNGAITQLRQECPFLKEQDIEFIGLIFSGMSVRAVCYLTGLYKANYYQKKNRLRKRIADSDASSKAIFIDRLSNFTK